MSNEKKSIKTSRLLSYNSKNIILISGKARAGKDYTAVLFKKYLEKAGCYGSIEILHFAQALKDYCKTELGWDGNKDENGRKLLQKVGAEKRAEDKDYWVKKVAEQIEKSPKMIFIIPDTRFYNEIEYFANNEKNNTIVMRVDAETLLSRLTVEEGGLTAEQKKDVSETELDDILLTCKNALYVDNDRPSLNESSKTKMNETTLKNYAELLTSKIRKRQKEVNRIEI